MSDIDSLIDGVRDIVALPDSYLRLQQACANPDNGPSEVAAVIRNDPTLCARILRIANSAYFGFIAEIETVPRAVQALGIKTIEVLALADAAASAFNATDIPGVDLRDFWERSVWCGSMARRLAFCSGRAAAPENAFVCGLLHDIGHLILAARSGEASARARREAAEGGEAVASVERRRLGFDYGEVGGALLRSWQLPACIWEPLTYHTTPARYPADGAYGALVGIVNIAAVLTHSDDREAAAASRIDDVALDLLALDTSGSALDMLELSVEHIVETLALTDRDAREIGALMFPAESTGKRQGQPAPA